MAWLLGWMDTQEDFLFLFEPQPEAAQMTAMRKPMMMRTAMQMMTFIFAFCHHIWRLSFVDLLLNVAACELSASVCDTRSSIFSPRSRIRSMFSSMFSLTPSSSAWMCATLSADGSLLK